MVRFKKFLATAVAFTMIFGCSVTSFAADPDPVTGTGTSEGHVDKNVKDFVFPVTTDTTFNYTSDPERLIQATSAAKYSGATFPAAATDTGVYFLTDTDTYGNASNTVQAINKGAVDQVLTVNIKTAAAQNSDIDLAAAYADIATEDAKTTDGTAKLYLGGLVGGAELPISASGAEWKVKVVGNADNYEVVYKDNAYSFEKKATPAGAWKGVNIQVKGETTKKWALADTKTTAPELTITWKVEDVPSTEPSYNGTAVDVAATPAGPSITTKTATAVTGTNTEIAFVGEASDVVDIKYNGNSVKAKMTITDGKITVLSSWTDAWSSGMSREMTVTFADDSTDTFTVTKQ